MFPRTYVAHIQSAASVPPASVDTGAVPLAPHAAAISAVAKTTIESWNFRRNWLVMLVSLFDEPLMVLTHASQTNSGFLNET